MVYSAPNAHYTVWGLKKEILLFGGKLQAAIFLFKPNRLFLLVATRLIRTSHYVFRYPKKAMSVLYHLVSMSRANLM